MRLVIIFLISLSISAGNYFPNNEWKTAKPDQVGLDQEKIDKLFEMTFTDDASMSAVLIKDGYIIQEQYAEGFNESSFGTSWSTAKSFYAALVGISLDRGDIKSLDDPVAIYVDSFNTPEKE